MKLDQFEKVGRGERTRYVIDVGEGFQLILAGPNKIVKEVFRESDFEVRIDPQASPESWEREMQPVGEEHQQALAAMTALEQMEVFFKPRVPDAAEAENSVFVSLHRMGKGGTSYLVALPLVFLPLGTRLVTLLPPICSCYAIVRPFSGDPDLVLTINALTSPGGLLSANPGLAVESIVFGSPLCWPWQRFIPYFRVVPFFLAPPPCTFSMLFGGYGPP